MNFSLRVNTARRHKSWHFVGVTIEEGTFFLGDFAYVLGYPERRVKILQTSFIDGPGPPIFRATTLTVEEPAFPIEELIGATLVDRETAFLAGQPSFASHSKERP